jgi:hypothetical protein
LEVFFVGEEQKVILCTACRLKAQGMGLDYIKYKTNFGGCPQCRKEEGYYSLFEFRVEYGEHRFYFHTPYSIARKWFEKIDKLPKKAREKRIEEALPFGRPISEAEARAVTLKEVITRLKLYLGE